MNKTWTDNAWDDYLYCQTQDKKTLKKINELLKDIERNGNMEGIGKQEPLSYDLQGYFRRRITKTVFSQNSANMGVGFCCINADIP